MPLAEEMRNIVISCKTVPALMYKHVLILNKTREHPVYSAEGNPDVLLPKLVIASEECEHVHCLVHCIELVFSNESSDVIPFTTYYSRCLPSIL
jgi:hypothetical protein